MNQSPYADSVGCIYIYGEVFLPSVFLSPEDVSSACLFRAAVNLFCPFSLVPCTSVGLKDKIPRTMEKSFASISDLGGIRNYLQLLQ